jgi:hypothetical protein
LIGWAISAPAEAVLEKWYLVLFHAMVAQYHPYNEEKRCTKAHLLA